MALNLPMGPNAIAFDISDSGIYICGWMGIDPYPTFGSHAFLWNDGKVIDLGTPIPGCDSTEARGVNNHGQVCGAAWFLTKDVPGYIRGFFWSGGQMQEIGVLPGYPYSFAYDMNDAGQVIGRCYNNDLVGPAFVWQNGVMSKLDDLIPAELGLDIDIPYAINNAGQIAAHGRNSEGNSIGIILTPIPSPTGDFNGDCINDWNDILATISHWHDAKGAGRMADYNADGDVNVLDLLIVIQNWGKG